MRERLGSAPEASGAPAIRLPITALDSLHLGHVSLQACACNMTHEQYERTEAAPDSALSSVHCTLSSGRSGRLPAQSPPQ